MHVAIISSYQSAWGNSGIATNSFVSKDIMPVIVKEMFVDATVHCPGPF